MQKQFTFSYHQIVEDDFSEKETALFKEAVAALDKSYSPYSKFSVGCSVLLANGKIVSGANQEVASYPVCICAEGVALSTASSMYPNVVIEALFIVTSSQSEEVIAPCGVCRQRIVEYEARQSSNIKIYLKGSGNTFVRIDSGKDILPFAFGANHMPLVKK